MLPADSPFAPLSAPGPHPATAELRAYAAGTLAPADEHRIQAHALDCEPCAELLDGFAMTDAATTDAALATLRARLQARVGSDLALPAATLVATRPLWPRLAAAVALLGAIGAGLWGWEHQPTAEYAVAANHPAAAVPGGPAAEASGTANAPVLATAPAPDAAPRAVPAASDAAVATSDAASVMSPARPMPARPSAAEYAVLSPRRRAARLVPPGGPPAREELAPAAIAADAASLEDEAEARSDAQMRETPTGRAASVAPVAAATRENSALGRAKMAAASSMAQLARPSAATSDQAATPAAPAADSGQVAMNEVVVAVGKAKRANAAAGLPGNSVRVLDKPMPASPAIAPAPLGGTPALKDYLRREAAGFEPDETARHLPPGGSVKVRFVVGADGKVSNLQVVRGLRADYDEEALRIICEGPAWRPGIANGRRAALPMELTISF